MLENDSTFLCNNNLLKAHALRSIGNYISYSINHLFTWSSTCLVNLSQVIRIREGAVISFHNVSVGTEKRCLKMFDFGTLRLTVREYANYDVCKQFRRRVN